MEDEPKQVVITDIKMRFFSMVVFIIKWMLASIPAFIIIILIFGGILIGLQMAGISGLMPFMPNMSMDATENRAPPSMSPFPDTSTSDETDSE